MGDPNLLARTGAPKGAELDGLLRRLAIEFESDGHGIRCWRSDYDEDTSSIAPVIQEIAGKIAGSVG